MPIGLTVVKEGWMSKQGGITGWKPRYFCISNETFTFDYYGDEGKTDLKRSIVISPDSRIERTENVDGKPFILVFTGIFEGKEKKTVMTAANESTRQAWYDAFDQVINGVVAIEPDIDANFRVTNPLSISFCPTLTHDGNTVSSMITRHRPFLEYDPGEESEGRFFSVVMTDPDAPARDNPFDREFIHWTVVNISGLGIESGQVLLEYNPPAPSYNSGIHRYYVILLEQANGKLSEEELEGSRSRLEGRKRIRALEWARDYGMKPVGINGFCCEWEEHLDDWHEESGFFPLESYRSPAQQAKIEAEERERIRLKEEAFERERQLREEEDRERERRRMSEEEERERERVKLELEATERERMRLLEEERVAEERRMRAMEAERKRVQEAELQRKREEEERVKREEAAALRKKKEEEEKEKKRRMEEAEALRRQAEKEAALVRSRAEEEALEVRLRAEEVQRRAEEEAEALRITALEHASALREHAEREANAVRVRAEEDVNAMKLRLEDEMRETERKSKLLSIETGKAADDSETKGDSSPTITAQSSGWELKTSPHGMDEVSAKLLTYGVDCRGIFEGQWMNKKMKTEFIFQTRFVWIDDETKEFYWSKSDNKSDSKRKSVSLRDEVAQSGIKVDKEKWSIKFNDSLSGKGIDLQVVGTENNTKVASEWAKVAAIINLAGK